MSLLPEPLDLGGALPPDRHDHLSQLTGRRVLKRGGAVWVYPHRVTSDWNAEATTEIGEQWFVALEHAFTMVEYRARGAAPADEPGVLDVRIRFSLENQVIVPSGHGMVTRIGSETGGGEALLFASHPVELAAVGSEIRIKAPLGTPLRLALIAGPSDDELQRTLRAVVRHGVAGLVRQRTARQATLRDHRTTLRSDDAAVEAELEQAKQQLDASVGDVPGVGRSLVALAGAPRFDTAEACLGALALLLVGEHAIPRQVIRFIEGTRDPRGRVPAEVSLSGARGAGGPAVASLYRLFADTYIGATGDTDLDAAVLPPIEAADRGVLQSLGHSPSAVVMGLMAGVVGFAPDAPAGRVQLTTNPPPGWTGFEARGLRCGDTLLDYRMRRRGPVVRFELRKTAGPPVWITLAPLLADAPASASIDGVAVMPSSLASAGGTRYVLEFQAGGEHEVEYVMGDG